MFKLLVISILLARAWSLQNGAPTSVCETMVPSHGGGTIQPQSDAPPFLISPAAARVAQDRPLSVVLGSRQSVQYGGFLVEARDVRSGQIVGRFTQVPPVAKTISCRAQDDAVTHVNPAKKGALEFVWQPPQGYLGEIIFK